MRTRWYSHIKGKDRYNKNNNELEARRKQTEGRPRARWEDQTIKDRDWDGRQGYQIENSGES